MCRGTSPVVRVVDDAESDGKPPEFGAHLERWSVLDVSSTNSQFFNPSLQGKSSISRQIEASRDRSSNVQTNQLLFKCKNALELGRPDKFLTWILEKPDFSRVPMYGCKHVWPAKYKEETSSCMRLKHMAMSDKPMRR